MFEVVRMRVTFVCTGNTCRSPMAEALLKKKCESENLDVKVFSRGTSVHSMDMINPKSLEALKLNGINDFTHTAQQINSDDVKNSDIVLTMTYNQKKELARLYPEQKYKIFTLSEYVLDSIEDITDPYGKSQIFYNFCLEEINKLIELLYEEIKEQIS